MRPSEAVRHIQHVASMGLAPHVTIPVMLDAIGDVVPTKQVPFFWGNQEGKITDFICKDVPPHTLESAMVLNRYNTSDDVPTMDRLFMGPRPHNNIEVLSHLAGWGKSAFYNDMLRGNEAEKSVDFQLRDSSGIRGSFALTRSAKERSMNAGEMRRVAALVPHFLRAMDAHTKVEAQDLGASPDTAHIITNRAGEIISFSGNSANMILQLWQPLGSGDRLTDYCKRLPPAAMLVVERLWLIQSGRDAQPATLEVPTRWGVFRVSAVPMRATLDTLSEMVIVTIQPLIDKRLARAKRLLGTDLTAAERRVALRMAGGGDGDAIARDLGLSIGAYRQYAKRIYAALGVEGRIGVKAMLDS
jgi:DNA-binding CsgD family transcriptional regulator